MKQRYQPDILDLRLHFPHLAFVVENLEPRQLRLIEDKREAPKRRDKQAA